MVKIIQEAPSFGQRFSNAIGEGLKEGSKFYEEYKKNKEKKELEILKNKEKKELDILKKKAKIRPSIRSQLSLYDTNKAFKSNPENIDRLENLSHKYLDQGFEPDEAVNAAYNEILSSPDLNQETTQEESPGFFRKAKGAFTGDRDFPEKLGLVSKEGFFKDIMTGLAKGGRAGVGLLDFPLQLANKANYRGRGGFKTLTDYYDELTGGRGKPTNIVEELVTGIPLGVPGVLSVATEKALEGVNAPESVQHAAGILTFLASHKIKVPELKSVISDAKKVSKQTGKSTETILKEAQKSSGVDLEKVASGDKESIRSLKENMTKPPETSNKVKETPESIRSSKENMTKPPETSNKVKETPKSVRSSKENITKLLETSNKVKETPKLVFNKKAAMREREVFGAKLPESPLTEYYEIRKKEAHAKASKRPETLLREKEIRDRLAPQEEKLFSELREQKDKLSGIERARKKISEQDKARIETLYQYQLKKFNETSEALKDIQYEMKYGRSRPSEAEIDAQISKSIQEFESGIANPTEAGDKKITGQLKLDKKYLDRASKLIERGELPGEIRPDTFIKMKKKYLEGYKSAIQKSKENIKGLKGETDVASKKKLADQKKFINRLSNRVKRLEADIVNQTDNIKSMRALEKPSGAFYKQQIKSLKNDNILFKEDLFKQKKHIKSAEEIKTSKVSSKVLNPLKKGEKVLDPLKKGEEVALNPTKENIKTAAEEAGKPEKTFSESLREIREEVKTSKESVKNGDVTPNSEHKFIKTMKKTAVGMGSAAAAGAIQALLEEAFGVKLNPSLMKRIAYGLGFATFGTTTIGRNTVREFFDSAQAEELKKLKSNPAAWNRYITNMEKKYGKEKSKRVLKIVNSKS